MYKKISKQSLLLSQRFSHFRIFVKLRSTDILLGYCSTACVTVCSVSPGIVGAIGCGIAVLSDAFGFTSAPLPGGKGRADVRIFASLSTNSVRHFRQCQLFQEKLCALMHRIRFINDFYRTH